MSDPSTGCWGDSMRAPPGSLTPSFLPISIGIAVKGGTERRPYDARDAPQLVALLRLVIVTMLMGCITDSSVNAWCLATHSSRGRDGAGKGVLPPFDPSRPPSRLPPMSIRRGDQGA